MVSFLSVEMVICRAFLFWQTPNNGIHVVFGRKKQRKY
jgi:hypothetical protein